MPGLQEETDSPPEPEDDYVADELPSMAMDGNQKHGDNGYSNSPKSYVISDLKFFWRSL